MFHHSTVLSDEQAQELLLKLSDLADAHHRANNLEVANILSEELVSFAEDKSKHEQVQELIDSYNVVPRASRARKVNGQLASFGFATLTAVLAFFCIKEFAVTGQNCPSKTPIALNGITNCAMDWLVKPPSGLVNLAGDIFVIKSGAKAVFQSSHFLLKDELNQVTINIPKELPAPRVVKMLVSGGYVDANLRGKRVGEIVIKFSDGTRLITPLIALKNIREDWYYAGQIPAIETKNVYKELQMRDGKEAYGLLDELSIPLPASERSNNIASITIKDTSLDTANSLNPSIQVSAISFD